MAKVKHSKFKNTNILFELLVRQITADILEGVDDSKSLKILKKYFNGTSILSRELGLYQALIQEKFNSESRAKDLISAVLEERKKLSNKKLRSEKYNLIKELKEEYDIDQFFSSPISNYKEMASVYKLFENETTSKKMKPADKIKNNNTLIEHITKKETKNSQDSNTLLEDFKQQSKDLRLLSYKILIDRFNEKYDGLDENQKLLIREYINNISNTNSLRSKINQEVDKVKLEIENYIPKVEDKTIKIKLNEVLKHIDNLKKGKVVKDEQVVSLLKYYELLKELKNVKK